MAIPLNDLDQIFSYDPYTHTVGGMPSMRLTEAGGISTPVPAAPTEMPRINTVAGSPDPYAIEKLVSPAQQRGGVGKQLYRADMPSVDVRSPDYLQQKDVQERFKQEHPLGSTVSERPGVWGKLEHGLATAGNIAGNALIPGVMESVPGTQLHNEFEEARRQKLEKEQAGTELEKAQTAGWAPTQITLPNGQTAWVPMRSAAGIESGLAKTAETEQGKGERQQTGIEAKKEALGTTEAGKEQRLGETIAGQEKIKGESEAAQAQQAEANRQNQLKIATMRDNLQDVISRRGEQERRDIATQEYGTPDRDMGPAPAGSKEGRNGTLPDGTKVTVKDGRIVAPGTAGTRTPAGAGGGMTVANKGRAEFAKTVIDQIPSLNTEIDSLAGEIGPGAGRWNQYWVNKGGANDPAFAALDQDLGLFASAVAVTHFGARGGGQHFIEQMRKDFSEAQSPEDLKARIKSAQKWIGGYAEMGEKK